MVEKEFYSVEEVAKILNLSRDRIYEYLRTGYIRGSRLTKKSAWRIHKDEVERIRGIGVAKLKEQAPGKPEVGLPEVARRWKQQLYTPPAGVILIDDLGSLGDHSARLKQDMLSIVLRDLGIGAGLEVITTATTWGAARPADIEMFWHVLLDGSVQLYCPEEQTSSFSLLLTSLPKTAAEQFANWKKLGGQYLTGCVITRRSIHEDAKTKTAGLLQDIVLALPRVGQPPPAPLTADFGNLVYILSMEYASFGRLPDPSLYRTRPGSPPIFVELTFGQAQIRLATTLPGIAPSWAEEHRRMIADWGKSSQIRRLSGMLEELRTFEGAINKELERFVSLP